MIVFPDPDLVDRYEAVFGFCVVGPRHTPAQIRRAEIEMRRALEGHRGALSPTEFPLDTPPGAEL